MAGDPKPNILSKSIGLRLQKMCSEKFKSKSECARTLGMAPQSWVRVEAGRVKFDPDEIYRYAAFFGVDPGWLLTGRGAGEMELPSNQDEKQENDSEAAAANAPTPVADLPPGNAIRRKGDQDAAHKVLHLRAVGSAAAFQVGASRGGFDDAALYWDHTEEIPESTHLIKICGDSMEPVMMHGQSVMVGMQYQTEIGEVPRHRELVVAEVTVQDNDIGGIDGEWEGVHCKRIQDGGDFWLFTSINPRGATFSVAKDNCHLWHVIGTYYGEKSKIPEED
jgi:transcriptional regulator with XRE-family HTH domain